MAETVSLTVSALTFLGDNGTAIFSGHRSDGQRVRVVARAKALPRHPIVGEAWTITGDYRVHHQYGRQLYATRGSYAIPKGRLLITYLTNHPDFSGIGEGKARALYDAFGERLVGLLDTGDAKVLEAVLKPSMAERLVAAWAEHQAEAAVVAFLDEHGFDIRLANKLRKVWGSQAIEMLTLNPYYMLAFASWRRADAAALKLGVKHDDERRLVGAVEAALYERLQDAHTVTPAELLYARVTSLLGARAKNVRSEAAIELAVAEGAVLGNASGGYQPVGAAALETRIAERLRAMMAGEVPTQFNLFKTDFGPDWLHAAIAENEAAQGFPLNAQQREAVFMAATRPFSVLTGGAGVGKTTVLRVVIDIAKRLNLKVLQMALAGRAAKRMAEATGQPAMTIAKFLLQANHGLLEVTPDSLVIVDEASMLDLPTAFRILRHLPDGARLLLVGDPAQLPPIGFGLVFHRLVESPAVPQVELTEVHRQAAESGIPAVASAIRQHETPMLRAYTGRGIGVSFIECASELVQGQLRQLAEDWAGDDWQVLGAIKDGPAGITAINWRFHELNESERLAGFRLGVGEPVIHVVNDYERGLMNGTLGRIVNVRNADAPGLLVDFEGTEHFIPAGEVSERLDLAYAISVHKAQGSQFRRVAVAITKTRILDHALIYTALTRGIEQVVFVGDRAAFEQGIQAPALAHLRQVGFVI
ncbi:AAA family ATPase [Burkholderia pseudomallei]|uniref:AAA family ATPase n=1 Tax=Burkholderia pseudomallei TaxID=28450 RepID=UPI001AAF77AB|nr:AAA family ATPase [Burkholderia pseudomallei]